MPNKRKSTEPKVEPVLTGDLLKQERDAWKQIAEARGKLLHAYWEREIQPLGEVTKIEEAEKVLRKLKVLDE